METTIRNKQYGSEIILPNLTSEAGAKTYGPPCTSDSPPSQRDLDDPVALAETADFASGFASAT
jgi:hypothetical protein